LTRDLHQRLIDEESPRGDSETQGKPMELTNVLRGAESLLNLPLSHGDITSALEVLNRIRAELKEREEANKMKSYVVHAEVGEVGGGGSV